MKPNLEFYYKNLGKEEIYLCNKAADGELDKHLLLLFEPDKNECDEYNHSYYAWGEERDEPDGLFNEFRQNVVLLIAAMNNEL